MVKFETYRESEIICPYCEYEHVDSWEWEEASQDETLEKECDKCEKKFYACRNIDVSYSSEADCKLNGEAHEWQLIQWHDNFDFVKCENCGKEIFLRHPETNEIFWQKKDGTERVYVEGSIRNIR